MNFEKYVGKKVRVHTSLIDEETDTFKVIEGVFEGWESLGASNYIIVDGKPYPEMCMNDFGLVPEKKVLTITQEIIEEEFVPAFTLQVDPLDMIDASTEISTSNVEVITPFNLWCWDGLIKVTSTLMILLITLGAAAALSYHAPSTYDMRYAQTHTYWTSPPIDGWNMTWNSRTSMCNAGVIVDDCSV